jgi:PDZ domain-containing protein
MAWTKTWSFAKRYRTILVFALILILLLFAQFKPWPYVISGPGMAEPVHPRVETSHKLEEKGAFLFTSVSTYHNPNAFALLYGWLNPRMDIATEEEATGGTVNYDAYRNLLAWMRDTSEASALLAAYKEMNRKIDYVQKGVIVQAFLKDSKARGHGLQEGDIITSVDGKPALTVQALSSALQGKKPGDTVTLAGTRGGKPFSATVPLIRMSDGRTGVGFYQGAVVQVKPPEKIQFDFNDTGGPSAGLMITLEIVAQLTGQDLTKGYRIAGTGTIDADGKVGQIGGIQYKLMAADREKADYFLVPYDKQAGLGNWNTAQSTVKKLKLSPKLVPVSSLADALGFLRKLEPKPAADSAKAKTAS